MRDLRIILATAACLITGPILLARHYSEKYPPDDLRTFTDTIVKAETITKTTKHGSYDIFAVSFASNSGSFKYVDWFPDAPRIQSELSQGGTVTVWVDPGERSWIWQVHKAGNTIISMDAVATAVKANNRFDGILGYVLLAAGIISLVRTVLAVKKAGEQTAV